MHVRLLQRASIGRGRDPEEAAEFTRHVTLIGEAGRGRDVYERGRSSQQYPRALDPKLPSHVLRGEAEGSFERADERVATDAGFSRDLADAIRICVVLAHP